MQTHKGRTLVSAQQFRARADHGLTGGSYLIVKFIVRNRLHCATDYQAIVNIKASPSQWLSLYFPDCDF